MKVSVGKNSMRFIAILHFFSFVAQESISDLLSEDIGFFGDSLKWMKKGPEFFSTNTPRPRAKSFFSCTDIKPSRTVIRTQRSITL